MRVLFSNKPEHPLSDADRRLRRNMLIGGGIAGAGVATFGAKALFYYFDNRKVSVDDLSPEQLKTVRPATIDGQLWEVMTPQQQKDFLKYKAGEEVKEGGRLQRPQSIDPDIWDAMSPEQRADASKGEKAREERLSDDAKGKKTSSWGDWAKQAAQKVVLDQVISGFYEFARPWAVPVITKGLQTVALGLHAAIQRSRINQSTFLKADPKTGTIRDEAAVQTQLEGYIRQIQAWQVGISKGALVTTDVLIALETSLSAIRLITDQIGSLDVGGIIGNIIGHLKILKMFYGKSEALFEDSSREKFEKQLAGFSRGAIESISADAKVAQEIIKNLRNAPSGTISAPPTP
ncbi:MAG: hypothetical protein WCS85_03785 [Candidatus Peribacteraceae bacterium]